MVLITILMMVNNFFHCIKGINALVCIGLFISVYVLELCLFVNLKS